ncbi:hypothetical protein RRG08_014730 [Elysia crispata]|uniref:Uncharacterized protein n=1 Tax=Elysia crispata TaxID=231223 RepID=A0AAE1ASN7_9GAST|nr:hypothetical protein RRG08_014730 [Elysia crispata]
MEIRCVLVSLKWEGCDGAQWALQFESSHPASEIRSGQTGELEISALSSISRSPPRRRYRPRFRQALYLLNTSQSRLQLKPSKACEYRGRNLLLIISHDVVSAGVVWGKGVEAQTITLLTVSASRESPGCDGWLINITNGMGLSFIGTISWARPTCDEKEAARRQMLVCPAHSMFDTRDDGWKTSVKPRSCPAPISGRTEACSGSNIPKHRAMYSTTVAVSRVISVHQAVHSSQQHQTEAGVWQLHGPTA